MLYVICYIYLFTIVPPVARATLFISVLRRRLCVCMCVYDMWYGYEDMRKIKELYIGIGILAYGIWHTHINK
jgi:hypothetical protein